MTTKKYQKVISRNHWMFRLFKFCWGREVKYEGYCPLFWMTIFNLCLLPVVVTGRIAESLFGWIGAILPERKEKELVPSDWQIICMKDGNGFNDCSVYFEVYAKWIEKNPDWEERILPEARRRYSEITRKEYYYYKAKSEEKREKVFAEYSEKIVAWAKYLVKPALAGSAIFAAWLVYRFILLVWSVVTLEMLWGAAQIIVGISIVALATWGVVKLISFLLRLRKLEERVNVKPKEPSRVWAVLSFFPAAWEFIVNTIQIVYYQRCPLIVLSDDETKPIEKIK